MSTLSSQPAKVLAIGAIKPSDDILQLRQSGVTIYNGYHSKIEDSIILSESSLAIHSESFASSKATTHLISAIRNVTSAMASAVPQRLALASAVTSISPGVLTGCSTDSMRMAHSPITASRGFNAIGASTMALQVTSHAPAVEGVIHGDQVTILQQAAVAEISGKHISASTKSCIFCSTADIICGRPRHLLDMDDKPLTEFDAMTMEQVDFIITNGGET